MDRDAVLRGGEVQDAACVSHQDRSRRIAVRSPQLLDDHRFGARLRDDSVHRAIELRETSFEREIGVGLDDTGFNQPQCTRIGFDDPISRRSQSRVDA